MKKISSLLIFCLVFQISLLTSCARLPTEARSKNIMEHYFKKYSKKYPESMIGRYPVDAVQVLHTDEIHKGMVTVYAILTLRNSMQVQTRFRIQKKPLAWRAAAWENMGLVMAGKQDSE